MAKFVFIFRVGDDDYQVCCPLRLIYTAHIDRNDIKSSTFDSIQVPNHDLVVNKFRPRITRMIVKMC